MAFTVSISVSKFKELTDKKIYSWAVSRCSRKDKAEMGASSAWPGGGSQFIARQKVYPQADQQ